MIDNHLMYSASITDRYKLKQKKKYNSNDCKVNLFASIPKINQY